MVHPSIRHRGEAQGHLREVRSRAGDRCTHFLGCVQDASWRNKEKEKNIKSQENEEINPQEGEEGARAPVTAWVGLTRIEYIMQFI